jgi:hypothetical protein
MSKNVRCDICDKTIGTYEDWFQTPKIKLMDAPSWKRCDVCSQCWKLMSEVVKYLRKTGEVEVKLGVFHVIQKEDERAEAYAQLMRGHYGR